MKHTLISTSSVSTLICGVLGTYLDTPALADLMHSHCWLEVALYCVETLPGLHNTLLTAVTMVHTATRNTATRNF